MTEGLTLALLQSPALLSSGLGAVPDWAYHISGVHLAAAQLFALIVGVLPASLLAIAAGATLACISQTTIVPRLHYDMTYLWCGVRATIGARPHPAGGWMFGRSLMVIGLEGLRWGPRGCQAAECNAAQAVA